MCSILLLFYRAHLKKKTYVQLSTNTTRSRQFKEQRRETEENWKDHSTVLERMTLWSEKGTPQKVGKGDSTEWDGSLYKAGRVTHRRGMGHSTEWGRVTAQKGNGNFQGPHRERMAERESGRKFSWCI